MKSAFFKNGWYNQHSMKNESNNIKEQLSVVLFDLLEKKPFQKITVNELCQQTHIHRSTFYLHFEDKYELVLFCLRNDFSRLTEQIECHTPQEFLLLFLEYCQEHEHVLSHFFHPNKDVELGDILNTVLTEYFIKRLYEKRTEGVLFPEPVEVVVDFYVGGFVNSTLQWVRSGCRISKEKMAACQYRMLKEFW